MVDPVKEMRKNGKCANRILPLETFFRSKCSRVEENASAQVSRGVGEGQRDATKSALVQRQVEQSNYSYEIWLVIYILLSFQLFPVSSL